MRMIRMNGEKHGRWPRILVCAPSNNAVDEIAFRLYEARKAANSKMSSK